MRLEKIKLSGFKSFVDPTTIALPSSLVGIVGPNGCGKSNVIDAVRWVMGESSAKHLRGDSMADVIFNGSSARKPVGQASIELVFSNYDGALGGQYANYNEIAIKRQVSRDGQSLYFLNGSRCRRRDITDIFLGTGLGTRSYAIIEQGTITRLIEARPDDLRIILEEAAGISKYKERRRETENRLRHTRDNLNRLNDIRDEIDKRLELLRRQAKAAERYRQLKQEERELAAQLLALRWRKLDSKASIQESAIGNGETELDRCLADVRRIEAEIERQRAGLVQANEEFNDIQSRFYGVGAEITRVEQAVRHSLEKKARQEQDLEQLEHNWNELKSLIERDQERVTTLEQALAEVQPMVAEFLSQERTSTTALYEAEEGLQAWQAAWDDFNRQLSSRVKTSEVEQTRLDQLDHQYQRLAAQREKLQKDRDETDIEGLEVQLGELEVALATVEQEMAEALRWRSELVDRTRAQRQAYMIGRQQLDDERARLRTLEGRHASLTALQDAALGKKQEDMGAWLSKQGLYNEPRLLDMLEVDRGWERAVETALSQHMDAVCVPGIDRIAERLGSLPGGILSIFDTNSALAGESMPHPATRLLAKLKSPWPLAALIGNVYCTETLGEALAQRSHLGPGESVITRDGIWLGRDWLRIARHANNKDGVIKRKNELEQLETRLSSCSAEVFRLQNQVEEDSHRLVELEQARDAQEERITEIAHRKTEIRAVYSEKKTRLEQARVRHIEINAASQEVEQELVNIEEARNAARLRAEDAQSRGHHFERRRDSLLLDRDRIRQRLAQARENAQGNRDRRHESAVRMQSMQTELDLKRDGLVRLGAQFTQMGERREKLDQELLSGQEPIMLLNEELDSLLQKRVDIEVRLGTARREVERMDNELRAMSQERFSAEQILQQVREKLEHQRLAWQETRVRCQTLYEQGKASGYALDELVSQLAPNLDPAEWEAKIERLGRHVKRLEPVNLAAIDEYEKDSERKTYLDAQAADLLAALDTLQDAIQRIDRESRSRFKDTFDRVNEGLQHMFPRLFGGGRASLEMTGDNLLETGISIMARPPGKRNSTIHLLSGGEKALTAVALVFAIFELNPAPFCLLDEVDAPLDDTNVARYCELVKEMSERIQFIFITHNKIAMEMADQVIGVTMHEPGVSRLVSVDMEAALSLAAHNMAAAG